MNVSKQGKEDCHEQTTPGRGVRTVDLSSSPEAGGVKTCRRTYEDKLDYRVAGPHDHDRPNVGRGGSGQRQFCPDHNIEYVVLKRLPKPGLPRREGTGLPGF